MVNELIAAGLLEAVEHPADRRSFHVRLSDAGRHKFNVARSDMAVFREKLSGRYSAEAIRALNEFAALSPDHHG
jgi:DNA-binding MarR family transcriptional regulator